MQTCEQYVFEILFDPLFFIICYVFFSQGDDMKMFVAIANKIYEIDRLRNLRIVYTGPENMTIQAVDYHYRNQTIFFTDPLSHKVKHT